MLHRAVNIDSFMVKASNPREGMIVDLYHAINTTDDDGLSPLPLNPKTFFARDLLTSPTPRHVLPRHDLESFANILSWIIELYIPTTRSMDFGYVKSVGVQLPIMNNDFRTWKVKELKRTCADPLWQRIRADYQAREEGDLLLAAKLIRAEEFLKVFKASEVKMGV